MAESLLAVLLVTSSAEKSTVAFRWPPHPYPSPRLVRQRPVLDMLRFLDAPYKASHQDCLPLNDLDPQQYLNEEGFECEWRRPGQRSAKRKSRSRHRRNDSGSQPASRSASPRHDEEFELEDFIALDEEINPEYGDLLGFTVRELGRLLTPAKRALFHQKFELVVDDLVFIGHPVCKEDDNGWSFKKVNTTIEVPNPAKLRGRTTTPKPSRGTNAEDTDEAPTKPERHSALDSFHLVLVLDHPDPSSAASGNLSKYYDQIYEHIAFPVTAMLFREQMQRALIEKEVEILGNLEEKCI